MFCKEEEGLEEFRSDRKMSQDQRMAMERCLTKNYLLAKGLDYFGKRDFIYIDMQGTDNVEQLMGPSHLLKH